MICSRFLLRMIQIIAALVFSGAAYAEVHKTLAVDALDRLVLRYAGQPLGEPTFMLIRGQSMRMQRWQLPIDFVTATEAVENEMTSIFGNTGQGEGVDAYQVVGDGYAVFFAPDREAVPVAAGEPRFTRTILLRPLTGTTELVVTEHVTGPAAAFSPMHRQRAFAWALGKEEPDWWAADEHEGVSRLSVMFVSPKSQADGFEQRLAYLRERDFSIESVTRSNFGTMITVHRGGQRANIFSYTAEDGAYTEIVHQEIAARPRMEATE